MTDYLKSQIITYMGNKRKLLDKISGVVDDVSHKLGKTHISVGDGFSGSGIVSRLLKTKTTTLYTNDIAGYSKTLNECFLSTPSTQELKKVCVYIDKTNEIGEKACFYGLNEVSSDPWVSKYWAPQKDEDIKETDRVYFTRKNAIKIDAMRDYIETIPTKYRSYVLALLLVETSIHNNTNGQFAAFYKNGDVGAFGGKNGVDVRRITKDIHLPYPILCDNPCDVHISQQDTNEWVKNIPELDLVYYDPPYNKHPYNIYYFLLDIVNDWDKTIEVPDTYRGQPKNWTRSKYNSSKDAKDAFKDLMDNTRSKYVLISYNSTGIINIDDLMALLELYGDVKKIVLEHKTYNKLKGIGNYKREKDDVEVKEFLLLVEMKQKKQVTNKF